MVHIEVVGRHALLFDDDGNAAFVNSAEALVEWNSLSIDRYDVRHLLSSPPPPRKRRLHHSRSSSSPPHPDASIESDLDYERYLDLPSPSEEQDDSAEPSSIGGYTAVGFSYGNHDESTEQKIDDADPAFLPSFPVPESLLQNLPPTEKLHQIIARTAMFVGKHGGQSEIVLRVKQGGNPMFGFLMPDHHLHAYYRFLVEHQELLKSSIIGKSPEEENKTRGSLDKTVGAGSEALSLLGSVYGGGEDEDVVAEDSPEAARSGSVEVMDATVSLGSELAESSSKVAGTDAVVSKLMPPSKEKISLIKKNRSISTVKAATTNEVKKTGDALGSSCTEMNKPHSSVVPNIDKVEAVILEPPQEIKRVIDKIVEFVMRNGKEFEAVLIEQDKNYGRFPFLLPANKYHRYYLKVLQKAQESKLSAKGFSPENNDSKGHSGDKKASQSKGSDALSSGSVGHDIPYDSDKKEKFKMVIGKSKDVMDPPSRASQPEVEVSSDAVAAILQAATRGFKNPSLEILQRSLNVISKSEKLDQDKDPSVTGPVARATGAASEADTSEAAMTKEQKLKAERLKRAKMFAAMIKNGAAPPRAESSRGLSVEPSDSGVSVSGVQVSNLPDKEREGSSIPLDVESSGKNEKANGDEYSEQRSKRRYRSRSERHEEDDKEEDEEEKHSKKRKSHRSSHHSRDRHRHRKSHSSKDRDSRREHKLDSSSLDEHCHSQRRHKRHHSSDEEDHSRHRHKRHHSSDDEDRQPRRHKHANSHDDDERRHRKSSSVSVSHRKRSHREREMDLEEGEISSKVEASENGIASREASLGLSNSRQDSRALSQPPETTQVSDDFRAKIRAMLLNL